MILSSQILSGSTTARPSGVGELSEQMLIGGNAERLISAPDDHPIGEALCPAK
jgi:hypothetical protein